MSHVHPWHGRGCAEGTAFMWASHCLASAVPGGKGSRVRGVGLVAVVSC